VPRKKTLEEVKTRLSEISNGSLTVLSEEYSSNRKPLRVRCGCGNEFERSYLKLVEGYYLCPQCALNKKSKLYRKSFDEVLDCINKAGCEYISGEYKNNKSELTLRCSCGNIFQKPFVKIQQGKGYCKECGKKKMADSKRLYDIDNAREILLSYGYTLLEDEFRGANEKHLCLCKNGHECNIQLSGLLNGRSGCSICAIDSHKGALHPNYDGGKSLIREAIRGSLNNWKSDIRELYDNTCPITGYTGEQCVVHHLDSFIDIFETASKKHNSDVSINGKLSDYKEYNTFDEIKKDILNMHTLRTGILISFGVHISFHSEYGHGHTTPEQFNEFLMNHYNMLLEDILRPSMKDGELHLVECA